MILYIHGRGISPFQWLLKDGLGTRTSRCACSRGARRPSCRPGPLTASSPPKGPTCRHAAQHRQIRGSNPEPAAHAAALRLSPPRRHTPRRGRGRRAASRASPEPSLPQALRQAGPPVPPPRERWDSVPGPGRLPQSPARPRALSLLRGDADGGGQAAHGPWGTPLRPAPPAPPASPVLGQGYGC